MKRLFLSILMGIIAVMFLYFAGFAENVATAFVFVLLATGSMLLSFYFYFGNIELK